MMVAWDELLQQHTSYGLTHSKDRPMDTKGITNNVGKAMNDECIPSLWRKELPYQLFFMYTTRIMRAWNGGQRVHFEVSTLR